MKTFEDDVRDMLRRHAGDVTPTPPPWQQLDASTLHRAIPPDGRALRTRRIVAIAAVAALVLGVVALRVTRDGAAPPPAVDDAYVPAPPPFDPETTAAIWPVGRDGTAGGWLRTAADEPERVSPAPSDDPAAVANAYLRDRFGPKEFTLGDAVLHSGETVRYFWRVPIDRQDATGTVHLRRVVLPNSLQRHAWMVVGATSDHVHVAFPRAPRGTLHLELSRRDADFATAARVELPTGTSLVDLDRPRSFTVPFDGPVTVRARLLGGAALTLTEFRLDPRTTTTPGTPLVHTRSELGILATFGPIDAAVHYLRTTFSLGPEEELTVEPVGGDSLDVRYRSPKLGTGVVRLARPPDGILRVVSVVGDGLHVEGVSSTDDRHVYALVSELPGRVTLTVKDTDVPIGRSVVLLPGPGMLAGVEVPLTEAPTRGFAPIVHIVVDGPHGSAVATYCLPV